jgi:hypothetical protein
LEMPSVADMFVEHGHGPTGSRNDQFASRRHILTCVAEQGGRIVDVLDDFGTDSVCRPPALLPWNILRLQQIPQHESGARDLGL